MSTITLDPKVPSGPLADKWTNFKASSKLVSPANKRRYELIVVGSGLAGGSAAAVFGEQGYNVKCFCYAACAQHRGAGWHQRSEELPR